MDVTIGESQDEGAWHREAPSGEGPRRRWDVLAERGWAVMRETRRWVVANPFAALGIALATGFVAGRVMRVWMLRP